MATHDIATPRLYDPALTEKMETQPPPTFRRDSPSPSISPTPALGACPELPRCVSTASEASDFSRRSSSQTRASLGSSASRQSSASYTSRQSTGGLEKVPKRRGFVRPQGTNFAASAQSRESVLSLGSIAHLQYYFARTGLLDGKGAQLARKRNTANGPMDLSALDTDYLSPTAISDKDSSYSSMRSSPELSAHNGNGTIVESPIVEEYDDVSDDDDDDHPEMLPPTVSTYNSRPKEIPRPPTLQELKEDLTKALRNASSVLEEARTSTVEIPPPSPSRRRSESDAATINCDSSPHRQPPPRDPNQGWFELQGMHILDIMTLAIRAAKMYYTAHDQPLRLASIKSERQIRTELLSVLEVLKHMATRNFAQGMRAEESQTMEKWITGVWAMLQQEEEAERAEVEARRRWTWLDDGLWSAPPAASSPDIDREYAFMKSMMDPDAAGLPAYAPSDFASPDPAPSPFLKSLQSGLRLVKLHNAIVKLSKRPFGAIPTFHTDTAKPYRCAENLRFWIKAAELRWEIGLKVDVMGVVNGTDAEAWKGFEAAVWEWLARTREELSADLKR